MAKAKKLKIVHNMDDLIAIQPKSLVMKGKMNRKQRRANKRRA